MAFNGTKFTQFLIKVGDGETPEVFTAKCTFNSSRGIDFDGKTEETTLPNCDTPDAVAWTSSQLTEISASISGEGTLHKDDDAFFFGWLGTGASKNVKLEMIGGTAVTYSGKFVLTKYSLKADKGQYVNASIELKSDGEVARA